MAQRLFGTDGIRGRAGEPPLDPATVRRLGAALVRGLPGRDGPPRILIGRDTRESGVWIERELARGARASSARVRSAGVISTPAVAYLTRREGFDAGLVISASHNPYEDNGIKVFSGAGEKFTEALEAQVEAIVADESWQVPDDVPGPLPVTDYSARYLEHVAGVFAAGPRPGRLAIGVDCANGATSAYAPRFFEALGFDVAAMGCHPDGRNINAGCGSTHPAALADLVGRRGRHLGIAFDGDGDRAIFVDEHGRVVDGDAVMLMCARHLQATGRLRGGTVVATVMSNLGLEIGLRETGIALLRTPVGDKYVMEELQRRNLSIGGEQSGHVIFSDYLFTGDGLVTALEVLQVMAATGRSLGDLASDLRTCPQVLLNVRVARRENVLEVAPIASAIRRVEAQLGDRGRLVVRYSGTEPLLRIMLEGTDQAQVERWAEEIAVAVRATLGWPATPDA